MPPRGSEGLNFSPILTHYLFLFTSILSVVRFLCPTPFLLEARLADNPLNSLAGLSPSFHKQLPPLTVSRPRERCCLSLIRFFRWSRRSWFAVVRYIPPAILNSWCPLHPRKRFHWHASPANICIWCRCHRFRSPRSEYWSLCQWNRFPAGHGGWMACALDGRYTLGPLFHIRRRLSRFAHLQLFRNWGFDTTFTTTTQPTKQLCTYEQPRKRLRCTILDRRRYRPWHV